MIEQASETGEGAVAPSPLTVPTVHLRSTRRARSLLALVIQQVWSGKVDPKVGNCVIYGISQGLGSLARDQELALGKRIAALEERAFGAGGMKATPRDRFRGRLNG